MLGAPCLCIQHFFGNSRITPTSSSSFFKLFLLVCGICASLSTLLVFVVEWGVAWVEVKVLPVGGGCCGDWFVVGGTPGTRVGVVGFPEWVDLYV